MPTAKELSITLHPRHPSIWTSRQRLFTCYSLNLPWLFLSLAFIFIWLKLPGIHSLYSSDFSEVLPPCSVNLGSLSQHQLFPSFPQSSLASWPPLNSTFPSHFPSLKFCTHVRALYDILTTEFLEIYHSNSHFQWTNISKQDFLKVYNLAKAGYFDWNDCYTFLIKKFSISKFSVLLLLYMPMSLLISTLIAHIVLKELKHFRWNLEKEIKKKGNRNKISWRQMF